MSRGGAQPGAGRPKGSVSKKTQELVAAALAEGVTPIDVMLGTMRKLWDSATTTDPEHIAILTRSGRTQHSVAIEACEIAAKAAPYCHAKLVAQTVKLESEDAAECFREIMGKLPT